MKIDRDSLRAQYAPHSDEELVEIAGSDSYSESARSVARELLAERGRAEASAPAEEATADEADDAPTVATKRSPPTRMTLLVVALMILAVNLGGIWLRQRDRARVHRDLVRLSNDASEERMNTDDIDPEMAALEEAASRGEIVLTVDRDGHVVATPVRPDAGQ